MALGVASFGSVTAERNSSHMPPMAVMNLKWRDDTGRLLPFVIGAEPPVSMR